MLDKSGYGHWRAKQRPQLLSRHAEVRYQWALERRDWDIARWRTIIFSDDAPLKSGKGSGNVGASGSTTKARNRNKELINPYTKSKGVSIMVWGSIWGGSHSFECYGIAPLHAPRSIRACSHVVPVLSSVCSMIICSFL